MCFFCVFFGAILARCFQRFVPAVAAIVVFAEFVDVRVGVSVPSVMVLLGVCDISASNPALLLNISPAPSDFTAWCSVFLLCHIQCN